MKWKKKNNAHHQILPAKVIHNPEPKRVNAIKGPNGEGEGVPDTYTSDEEWSIIMRGNVVSKKQIPTAWRIGES